MQFLKTCIFPYPNKTQTKNSGKTKIDLFIKSSFSSILGKSYYSLSYIFDIGKIIEDEINKSNDPLFQHLRELKYENNEISNSLRGSLSFLRFLGSQPKCKNKYDMHMMIYV